MPLSLAVAVALAACLSPGPVLSEEPSGPSRLDDTYAVLSLLFQRPSIAQVATARRGRRDPFEDASFVLVTDDFTLAPDPADEEKILECLHLPLEIRQEMVSDLRSHRDDRVPLDWSRMSFTRRYGRATEEQVASSRQGGTPRMDELTLTWFGYVYFNGDRSVAAAHTRLLGPLGGEGGWRVFARKADGSWEAQIGGGGCNWVT